MKKFKVYINIRYSGGLFSDGIIEEHIQICEAESLEALYKEKIIEAKRVSDDGFFNLHVYVKDIVELN